jgi:hypothetical protein
MRSSRCFAAPPSPCGIRAEVAAAVTIVGWLVFWCRMAAPHVCSAF